MRVPAAALAATLLLASLASAQDEKDDEPLYDAAAMARVEALLDADAKIAGRYAQCPADVFGTDRPFFGDLGKDIKVETCEADPAYCHSACVQALSGRACMGLARAMQDNEPETKGRYYESLFTQACATGRASGCTNRGGGIRNGGYADDPFRDVAQEAREGCLFRSFEIACAGDDAWGCAMLGQSYHYGEGVAADADAALRHYRRSCEIDSDFAACRFAESGIEDIEGREDDDYDYDGYDDDEEQEL